MTGCGFFLGLGFLLMSQISAVWQFYLFYGVIIGIGMSATFVPANSIVARWFTKMRGMMTAIVLAGSSVGTMVMPPIARWLISIYGWRVSYSVVGIIALVLIILPAQFLKREPSQIGQLPYGEDKARAERLRPTPRGFSVEEAVRTSQLWQLCAISLCIWFCTGIIMAHIIIHTTGLGISADSATSNFVVMSGVSVVGRLIMGGVADRIGNKLALIIGFVVMSISFFWLLVAREMWMLYLFGIIFGFAYGSLGPLVSLAVAELFGLSSHGAIFGVTFFAGIIGEAAGPVLAGGIFDVTGSYQLAFLICAAISVTGIIISFLLTPINEELSLTPAN
jgi:MFS family permease